MNAVGLELVTPFTRLLCVHPVVGGSRGRFLDFVCPKQTRSLIHFLLVGAVYQCQGYLTLHSVMGEFHHTNLLVAIEQYLVLRTKMFTKILAANAGDNKAAEIATILQKTKSKQGSNSTANKKNAKKRWKQLLAKSAFGGGNKKNAVPENGHTGDIIDCHIIQGHNAIENVDPQDLTLLQLLALNALELTAPASDILLKNRTNNWVQLSGHEGAFAPAAPGTIWKKRPPEDTEVQAYKSLMKDVMADVVPKFYRDVEYNGEHFIEMEDLLFNFKNPSIMDIKMGSRTFLETEVQNTKARPDLYEKMVKVDPNAPTEEERQAKAITKLRYMQFRENLSSSSTLGFRIEGYKVEGKAPTKDLKLVRERKDVITSMQAFLNGSEEVRLQLIDRLKQIEAKFGQSEFFQTHEVIGSSLLIIHDGTKAGAWMIDFAKTCPTPEGITLDHVSPWVFGNREDAYLFGLRNLISILEDCQPGKLASED